MPAGKKMQDWQKKYVELNHKEQTPDDMANAVKLSVNKIYVLCRAMGWVFKGKSKSVSKLDLASVKSDIIRKKSVSYEPDKTKEPIKRPPPVYSNSTPFGIAKQLHQ